MGRYITTLANGGQMVVGQRVVPYGYLGDFGGGQVAIYQTPGSFSFTVPAGVFRLRRRVAGAGGGGRNSGAGGGGGGYSQDVINVAPGQVIAIVVGAPGATGASPTAGGSSSCGTISATGGAASAGWA